MTDLSRRQLVSGLGAASLGAASLGGLTAPAAAQSGRPKKFETRDLVNSGHQFFGTISRGLAQAVEAAGRRFRETVMGLGGSVPPAEVFVAFRGREPSTQALLRHSGLLTASA